MSSPPPVPGGDDDSSENLPPGRNGKEGWSQTSAASAMRSVASAVHRASMHGDATIRQASVRSLETMAAADPLTVVQTWLDQFARTNGGSAPAEYAATERVFLLQSLERIVGTIVRIGGFDENCMAGKACTGRLIAMATEEMAKQSDVVPEVQKPCSAILVSLGSRYLDRVMDSLLLKLKPSQTPHYFVVSTLSGLSHDYPMSFVPYLKGVLSTMASNVKSVKKDNLRFVYSSAVSNFADALLEYLANLSGAPDPTLTKDHFHREVDSIHDVLFSQWLTSRDAKLRHAALESLGRLSRLLSPERLLRTACQVLTVLTGAFKKTSEPFFVTGCVFQVIDAVSETNAQVMEPVVEPLMTALFTQVCNHAFASFDYNKPFEARNHHEVLRCYDVLVLHHKEKLVNGLILRMGSLDESIRLAALTILKHVITSSFEQVSDRMGDIFRAVHSKLAEPCPKVQGMLARVTALLGRKGFLQGDDGRDFLEFVVRLCATGQGQVVDGRSTAISGRGQEESLGEMCGNILLLLSKSVPSMEALLWPHLLEFLVRPGYVDATTAIVRSLNEIMREKDEVVINFSDLVEPDCPQAVLSRLLVVAAVPSRLGRGLHILTFLKQFASNVNRHLPNLWRQRIPLLQHYLETHIASTAAPASSPPAAAGSSPAPVISLPWDQEQWESWLLDLLDLTIREIQLEEWSSALIISLHQQLGLYSDETEAREKCFLVKCLGVIMKNSTSRGLVSTHLSTVDQVCFSAPAAHQELFSQACAEAFGLCAAAHLGLVLDKLEVLLRERFAKRSSTFFGLLRDNRLEEEQAQARRFILLCISRSARHAKRDQLADKADAITVKFILPALKDGKVRVKVSALRAVTSLASAIQSESTELAQHGDLVHEAINCLGLDSWSLSERSDALSAILELIRCPPSISQMTRCSLLKACFSAVFPAMAAQQRPRPGEEAASQWEGRLKEVLDRLLTLVGELLKQDMQQSTLDEIFTLLETWMRKESALPRQMAVVLLDACLRTFLAGASFDRGAALAQFSPGPFIVGAVVPRCFDDARAVQVGALGCLKTALQILALYEGHAAEDVEEDLQQLSLLFSVSPTGEDDPIPPSSVSGVVVALLERRIQRQQLSSLLAGLVEALSDQVPAAARGTSIVLSNLLQARGGELSGHAVQLVEGLLCRLAVPDCGCPETRVRVLTSVRTLASSAHLEVCDGLLSLPVASPLPGQEEALASMWGVMTQEVDLAKRVLDLLVAAFADPGKLILAAEYSRSGRRMVRTARHRPVAALVALDTMLRMKEMEAVCEEEFTGVFIPLLTATCCLLGVNTSETVSPPARLLRSTASGSSPAEDDVVVVAKEKSPALLGPFGAARSALASFLSCRGCPSVSNVAATTFTAEMSERAEAKELGQAVCQLFGAIIQDAPQFLPKLSRQLQPLLCSGAGSFGRRLAPVAFSAEILSCDLGGTVEPILKQTALGNLLSALRWEKDHHRQQSEENAEEGESAGATAAGFLSEEERLEMAGAKRDVAKSESIAIRILCLKGLSSVRLDRQEEMGREDQAPAILSSMLSEIGDDFRSGLNLAALDGLNRVLSSRAMEAGSVHHFLTEVASKVRPFFDSGGGSKETVMAINCFACLSCYAVGAYAATFTELAHGAMVSLLLHANDEDVGVRRSSRRALAKILTAILKDEPEGVRTAVLEQLEGPTVGDSLPLPFDALAEAMSSCPHLLEMFPSYCSCASAYFRSPKPHMRASAVTLLSGLLSAADVIRDAPDGAAAQSSSEVNAELLCRELSNLLTSDRTRLVQEATAEAIGRVFVLLKKEMLAC